MLTSSDAMHVILSSKPDGEPSRVLASENQPQVSTALKSETETDSVKDVG